jgi:sugar-phosphatase
MDLIRRRKLEALPGAEEFVRSLWRHCPLGVCSGALREEIEAMLEGINLRDCFSVIVAAEDVEVGKPDPRGFVMAMEQLAEKNKRELKPKDCLIVEDAPKVIRRVKSEGFATLAVASSTSLEKLDDADYAVASLHLDEVKKKVPALRPVL